jgi:hypothetical protein
VCDPAGGDFSGHLAYTKSLYQKPSADFIVAAFKGQPLPKAVTSAADPSWPGNTKGRPAAKGQTPPKGATPTKGPSSLAKRLAPLAAGDQVPSTVEQLLEMYSVLTERAEISWNS